MVKGKLILATFPNCMLHKKNKYLGSSWILQMHTLYMCSCFNIGFLGGTLSLYLYAKVFLGSLPTVSFTDFFGALRTVFFHRKRQ